MSAVNKSRRGVYYDLTASPYEYRTPYGEVFKFRSAKKLEIYRREIVKELSRLEAFIARRGVGSFLTHDTVFKLTAAVYTALYADIEG